MRQASLQKLLLVSCAITALQFHTLAQTFQLSAVSAKDSTRISNNKEIVTPERLLADDTANELRDFSWAWLSPQRLVFSMREATTGAAGASPHVNVIDIGTGEIERWVEGWRPKPSPDGQRLSYLAKSEQGPTQIMLMTLPRKDSRSVAQLSDGANVDVVWSPDSQKIAYWAGDNEGMKLWVTREIETTALVTLPSKSDILDLKWSPDSRMIAYTCRPKPAPGIEDGTSTSVIVFGQKGFVLPDSEVWVLNVESGAKRKLASGPYSPEGLQWRPGAKNLLFTVAGSHEYKNDLFYQRITKVMSVADNRIVEEFKTVGPRSGVAYSPDGSRIAYVHAADFVPNYDILMREVKGKVERRLTENVVVLPSGLSWAPDGKGLYFRQMNGVLSQLGFVSVTGEIKQITRSPRNVQQLALSPDGRSIGWTTFDLQGGADLRVARADGSGERVLIDLKPELKNLLLGHAEVIKWKSRDGLEISGLLTKPVAYQPGRKYPLLVDIHGGPTMLVGLRGKGGILSSHPLESQMWAARGFAVFAPDYRSSGLYGRAPILKAREKQEFNARDFDDILSGVDHVINIGVADPDRLAVLGHSHGAYLTNWVITHTDRFKVAVSKEGYAREYVSYSLGLEGAGSAPFAWLHKGPPWEVSENYRKLNPAEYVKGVKTPTLFISGEKGPLDRYGNHILSGASFLYNGYLYTALKNQGVDSQFIVYRGEGHNIHRSENKRDLLMRVLAWVDSHLETDRILYPRTGHGINEPLLREDSMKRNLGFFENL